MISIIIPAYNEEKSIGQVLDDIKKVIKKQNYKAEIIVVDDGSADATAKIAESRGVKVVKHSVNLGVGAARTTGISQAEGDIIVMTDADGTYPAESIPTLVQEMENADMVIGARMQEKGTYKFLRTFTKSIIKRIASYLTRAKIPDLNSGLRAVKRDIVLKYKKYLPTTHSWVSTITIIMLYHRYRVIFIPIKYFKRVGHSTFHPLRDTYNYMSLVIRSIMYFDPLRFFLPFSLILLFISIIKSIIDFIIIHTLQESDIILFSLAILIFVLGLLADLIVVVNKSD